MPTTKRPDPRLSLVGLMRQLVTTATGPKPTRAALARLGGSSRYLLPAKLAAGDTAGVMLWTYRRLSHDLGAYISPAPSYFDDVVITEQLTPAVSTYQSVGGNIGRELDLAEPYFATYSGQFELERDRTIRLRIDTSASIWLGVDGDVVVASDTLGPNQHTDAVVALAAGPHTIEVGVYQQSGRLRYELSGNLAEQVDKVLAAPDREPPAVPGTPALALVLRPPGAVVEVTITPSVFDEGVFAFSVYRAVEPLGVVPPLGDFVRVAELRVLVPGGGVSFVDGDVELGTWCHYFATALDRSLNSSPASGVSSVEVVDVTAPGNVAAITANGTATDLNTPVLVAVAVARIAWTDPADADLEYVGVFLAVGSGMLATLWDASTLLAVVPVGVQSFDYVHGVGPGTSSVAHRLFLQSVDAYGNPNVPHPDPGSLYPPGAYLSILVPIVAEDVVQVDYVPGNEPNRLGWRKADTELYGTYVGSGSPSAIYYVNWPPDHGTAFWQFLSSYYTVNDETPTDGELLTEYVVKLGGTYSGSGSLRVRIDKAPPTTPTSLAAVRSGSGFLLTWADGVDTRSGVLESRVYRAIEAPNFVDAVLIATVAPGVETYLDLDVVPNTKYTYWIVTLDRADNASIESAPVVVYASSASSDSYLNWLDNSSFERGKTATNNPKWAPDNWLLVGDWSTADYWGGERPPTGFHGAHFPSLSAARTVKQEGVPLLGSSFMVTLWGRRIVSGTATARVTLYFRDVYRDIVQTSVLDFAAFADSDTWSRAVLLADSSVPVFGPFTPGVAPIIYPDAARTVDVEVSASAGGVNVDGLLMQEVYTADAGATWLTKEAHDTPPSPWVDSHVFNADRVNAWLGRFAVLIADLIVAGRLKSADAAVDFDLDAAVLRITHATNIYSELRGTGLRKTLDGGSTFYDYVSVRRFIFNLGTLTADDFVKELIALPVGTYLDNAPYICLGVNLIIENSVPGWSKIPIGNHLASYYGVEGEWCIGTVQGVPAVTEQLYCAGRYNCVDAYVSGNIYLEVVLGQVAWSGAEA